MSQGNLKKAILLQSHINFLQMIPLFLFQMTQREIYLFFRQTTWKPRKNIPVDSDFHKRKLSQLHSIKGDEERETVTIHLPVCQKSASRVKTLSIVSAITAKRWYSETRFSKKFVFPSREIFSMKSNGFSAWKTWGRKTDQWFWQGNNALKTPQQPKLSNSLKLDHLWLQYPVGSMDTFLSKFSTATPRSLVCGEVHLCKVLVILQALQHLSTA